jgi:glutathione S-transferase
LFGSLAPSPTPRHPANPLLRRPATSPTRCPCRCWWAHADTYETKTWPCLSQTLLAPLRWFVPSILRSRAVEALAGRGFDDPTWVRASAIAAYRALAIKLRHSNGPFFCGVQPCSADAVVYGHLASVRNDLPGA